MRVVTTTIMKDESAEFVERWAYSALDSDERVLVDTGTTQTEGLTCARDLGVTVHEISVQPWRFDDARNAAMSLLPECDVVITLDVDEILMPGWRASLESEPAGRR